MNRQKATTYLAKFDFAALFSQELGWDRATAPQRPLSHTLTTADQRPTTITFTPVAHKRGFILFVATAADGAIPPHPVRSQAETWLSQQYREHLIVFVDAAHTTQLWQWVRREPGQPLRRRDHRYSVGQSGESLLQKLDALEISFAEEGDTHLVDVVGRVRAAFNVERATKKFYDQFKKERTAFENFVQGIGELADRQWYVSIMLNRLMFTYFIQRKGFLDGNDNYLQAKLAAMQAQYGQDQFYSFYRSFLLHLFHDGLGKPKPHTGLEHLLGDIPYLNGGIFQLHEVEERYPAIAIEDEAFTRLFAFFDQYDWHLDDRPLRDDKEINPDVLGYIFEKYINQKQMGAYYTKEDITEYISQNSMIPHLFDAAEQECPIAFKGESAVWRLLSADPDRYIYPAVAHGTQLPLPPTLAVGVGDVAQREQWNTPTPDTHGLPTEIWRETIARRQRHEQLQELLATGQINTINALITHNLDIKQFAQDVIEQSEGSELLRAFWKGITTITVLDPTCGSGAFLFAALNILQPLYEACLTRMKQFVEELPEDAPKHKFKDFRQILATVAQHPNPTYYVLKSIMVNNLYGVDIMAEATEIAKLRLFLKLAAQLEKVTDIEPLPDIDFNIRAGNTLVGFATYEEAERMIRTRIYFDNILEEVQTQSADIARLAHKFRQQQTELGGSVTSTDKAALVQRLNGLRDRLNRYLAEQYGVNPTNEAKYEPWLTSHQPFHWFIEFNEIVEQRKGFDVVIGNPPYVEYSPKFQQIYSVNHYETLNCRNLYAFVIERSVQLGAIGSKMGMIIPISAFANNSMADLTKLIKQQNNVFISTFHQRPAQLFDGVLQRLSIFLLEKNQPKSPIYTTSVIRWYSKARSNLFQTLCFVATDQSQDNILKFGHATEISIYKKFTQQKPISKHVKSKNSGGSNVLWYRTAGGGYWWTFLVSGFTTQSLSNKSVEFLPNANAKVFAAILSSSLYWWHYFVNYDLFNLKDYMIFSFCFDYPFNDYDLIQLAEKLEKTLLTNSVPYVIKSKTKGEQKTYKYNNRDVKPIIDEIDQFLANHYGFTAEELDYIINYDIKYRMGDSLQDDDE